MSFYKYYQKKNKKFCKCFIEVFLDFDKKNELFDKRFSIKIFMFAYTNIESNFVDIVYSKFSDVFNTIDHQNIPEVIDSNLTLSKPGYKKCLIDLNRW